MATVGPDGPAFDLLLTLLVGADGRGGRMRSLLSEADLNGVRGPFLGRVSTPGRGIETFLFHGPQDSLPKVHELVLSAIDQLHKDLLAGKVEADEIQQGDWLVSLPGTAMTILV